MTQLKENDATVSLSYVPNKIQKLPNMSRMTSKSISVPPPPPRQLPTFSCLYTTQKQKKKKSWHDGEFRVDEGHSRVSLFQVDEGNATVKTFLESKHCSKEEMCRIKEKEAEYVEFEKHLVEIDYTEVMSSDKGAGGGVTVNKGTMDRPVSKLKFSKFKVPSTVLMPRGETNQQPATSSSSSNNSSETSFCRGHYAVDEDELDDIWESTHPENPSGAFDNVFSITRESVTEPPYEEPATFATEQSMNEKEVEEEEENRISSWIPTKTSPPVGQNEVPHGNVVRDEVSELERKGLWGESVWTEEEDEQDFRINPSTSTTDHHRDKHRDDLFAF